MVIMNDFVSLVGSVETVGNVDDSVLGWLVDATKERSYRKRRGRNVWYCRSYSGVA